MHHTRTTEPLPAATARELHTLMQSGIVNMQNPRAVTCVADAFELTHVTHFIHTHGRDAYLRCITQTDWSGVPVDEIRLHRIRNE